MYSYNLNDINRYIRFAGHDWTGVAALTCYHLHLHVHVSYLNYYYIYSLKERKYTNKLL